MIYSKYGESINTRDCLSAYPRMLMQRDNYTCLNGIWQYQITKKDEEPDDGKYQDILVPFAVGSLLSGTDSVLNPDEILWYRKKFIYHARNDKTILHFEAVDQTCVVFFNNVEVARHSGGYLPFSIDITNYLQEENILVVAVVDKSNQGICAYGKQKINGEKIWYKPTAGIWQTVWMEDVNDKHIENIKITPLFDEGSVFIQLFGDFDQAVITVRDNGEDVFKDIVKDKRILLHFDKFKPWTCEDPFLYEELFCNA